MVVETQEGMATGCVSCPLAPTSAALTGDHVTAHLVDVLLSERTLTAYILLDHTLNHPSIMFKKYTGHPESTPDLADLGHSPLLSRFNPKEDVASSTSLKSSVQRHIRNALLEQYPYLATPLNPSAEAEAPAAAAAGEAEAELEGPAEGKEQDDDDEPRKKGGKKGGKGGGKKDKGGKGAKGDKARSGGAGDADDADKEDGPDADAVLLDELWPRKEALGITKWCVVSRRVSPTGCCSTCSGAD